MKEGKKQMNEFDRCGIETRLALGTSVRQIAKDLDRELSTISREIKIPLSTLTSTLDLLFKRSRGTGVGEEKKVER